jgi:MPBQ/MSBQ methyltransferase
MKAESLSQDSNILDCGSGIGGPARFVAREYGHRVLGVDLTSEYVDAANILSERTGMAKRTKFVTGSVLDLNAAGVRDSSMDAVRTRHPVLMHISQLSFACMCVRVKFDK